MARRGRRSKDKLQELWEIRNMKTVHDSVGRTPVKPRTMDRVRYSEDRKNLYKKFLRNRGVK